MTALIIGSEGFIGKQLVSKFLSAGYQTYGADLLEVSTQEYQYRKVSRLSPELDELFASTQFDVCINASGSANVSYSLSHPLLDFESNCLDTIRILDAIRRLQRSCKYVHISSAAVYGNPVTLPVAESAVVSPLSPYGWHKAISEQICLEYSRNFQVPLVVVRPFSVYGPGLRKQLFWELNQKVLKAGDGGTIELWGTGQESRDFIYISDFAESIKRIVQASDFGGQVYNLATGKEVTVNKVAALFVQALGRRVEIRFNNQSRAGDPKNWRADVAKVKALGFNAVVDIEEGIRKTAAWLSSHTTGE
jgi:UDP-glucose 4-epimerase